MFVCLFLCKIVFTLHPASNLSRHDGRRSFAWLLSEVAVVVLLLLLLLVVVMLDVVAGVAFAPFGDVGVVGDPVFLSRF